MSAGTDSLECRPGCGACCIAPSISSLHKPADLPCMHLKPDMYCGLWGSDKRPLVCSSLKPSLSMCGSCRDHALSYLSRLEELTRPD